jgi:hypothetical protein
MAIYCQVSPASLLDVSAGNCQTALMNESGTIITQMGTHNRSEMVAVHGTPCVITPRNSNLNAIFPSLPRSSKQSLLFRFSGQNLYFHLFRAWCTPTHRILHLIMVICLLSSATLKGCYFSGLCPSFSYKMKPRRFGSWLYPRPQAKPSGSDGKSRVGS